MRPKRYHLEYLEPRLLLSADPVAEVVGAFDVPADPSSNNSQIVVSEFSGGGFGDNDIDSLFAGLSVDQLSPDRLTDNVSPDMATSARGIQPKETFELSLTPGWNLVSLPFEAENGIDALREVFPEVSVWRWDGQDFVIATSLTTHVGYWIQTSVGDTVTLSGQRAADNRITLKTGWNLTGTTVDSVLRLPENGDVTSISVWDSGSQKLQTLHSNEIILNRGVGYWIYSNTSGQSLELTPINDETQSVEVVEGDVEIVSDIHGNTFINQVSDKAVIDWRSFEIDPNTTLTVNMPSSNSVMLIQTTGSKATAINGQLNASGMIYIVNPNGILFGEDANIQAESLTLDSANGSIAINGPATVGDLLIDTNNDIKLAGQINVAGSTALNSDIRLAGDIVLASGSGDIVVGSITGSTGSEDLTISATNGNITLGQVGIGIDEPDDGIKSLTIESGGITKLSGTIFTNGDVAASGTTALTMSSGGTTALSGAISLSGLTTLGASGASIEGSMGKTGAGVTASTGERISIDTFVIGASGDLTTNDVTLTASGHSAAEAAGDITIGTVIMSNSGELDLSAGAEIVFNNTTGNNVETGATGVTLTLVNGILSAPIRQPWWFLDELPSNSGALFGAFGNSGTTLKIDSIVDGVTPASLDWWESPGDWSARKKMIHEITLLWTRNDAAVAAAWLDTVADGLFRNVVIEHTGESVS